jgi:Xaa-Pro aminopeptidase
VIDVAAVQAALAEQELDAWLLYDFRGQNAIARSLAGVPQERMTTRRWFWLVPRTGESVAFVSALEPGVLEVPGRRIVYRSWRELEWALQVELEGLRRVAMEVSPLAAVPYLGRVDWGTVELVRSFGVSVVSSGDLVQLFEARATPRQRSLHDRAATAVLAAKDDAFTLVRERLASGQAITESALLAFIGERLASGGLAADHPSMVAVNDHAANPHFETAAGPDDRAIAAGDLVLLDVWAKVAGEPDAVYGDITWMGYCGSDPSRRVAEIWAAVRDARDAAIDFVRAGVEAGRPVHGFEVDRAGRGVIEQRGFGEQFVHRLGHSLGVDGHGNGVNMDDLETRDERLLVPGLLFTIEPGIYLPGELGVRSEVNVFVGEDGIEVTTDIQRELVLLA